MFTKHVRFLAYRFKIMTDDTQLQFEIRYTLFCFAKLWTEDI